MTSAPGPTPSESLARDIVVLGGGYSGARFTRGLLYGIREGTLPGVGADARVTVIANTGDDLWIHGLRVCPDLDTVMYSLGDGIDPDRGWGRRNETWSAREELSSYGSGHAWFGLGDRDLATHLVRTEMLRQGWLLSEVTQRLGERWGLDITLLPMTDQEVESHLEIDDPEDGRRLVHFQEYWVRYGARVAVHDLRLLGVEHARPAPGVLDAVAAADLVLLAPSNPIVSIGTITQVPGIRDSLLSTSAPIVGLSPIIAGTHLRGMAAQLLEWAGVEVSAAGVGRHYGARARGGLVDGWLVDERDRDAVEVLSSDGISSRAVPLLMTDLPTTATMAAAAVGLAAAQPART